MVHSKDKQHALKEQLLQHFSEYNRHITLQSDPFPHFYSNCCFPPEIYQALISNLPSLEFYDPYMGHGDAIQSDGSTTRYLLPIHEPAYFNRLITSVKNVWTPIVDVLTSSEMQQIVFNLFESELNRRFDNTMIDQIKAYPAVLLVRDFDGYRIKPHPDAPTKIITIQFYLPEDNTQTQLGTTLYDRVNPSLPKKLLWKLGISSRTTTFFTQVKELSFEMNSGYGFVVSSDSFHGRKAISVASSNPRNSLMLVYYSKPNKGY